MEGLGKTVRLEENPILMVESRTWFHVGILQMHALVRWSLAPRAESFKLPPFNIQPAKLVCLLFLLEWFLDIDLLLKP